MSAISHYGKTGSLPALLAECKFNTVRIEASARLGLALFKSVRTLVSVGVYVLCFRYSIDLFANISSLIGL